LESNAAIGSDSLVFQESIFSPIDLPGKALMRDISARTIDDQQREDAIEGLKLEQTGHADQVDGAGRDLRLVFGIESETPSVYIPLIMSEIRRRCNNNAEIDNTGIPDFRGIMIGDYIDGLDLSGVAAPTGGTAPQEWNDAYKNNRIEVSGFNTYKGAGDTVNTKNHILFTFRNCIAKGRMNSSDTNAGGYPASELRSWLEGAAGDGGTFAPRLRAQLGNTQDGLGYLYTVRLYHGNKHAQAYDAANWKSFTVFPPTEIEVHGFQTWGDELSTYNTNVQYPIYQKSFDKRIKKFNGSRQWWWESSALASGATYFCGVSDSGYASYAIASNTDGGVAPAFCVA
jgi:hypothetical protein